jgi:peptide/nickel transport system substrate-binding protein
MQKGDKKMRTLGFTSLSALSLGASVALGLSAAGVRAETPVSGGELHYVVASDIPSFDAHQEETFGVVHPLGPLYSLLLRVNPENPQSPTDIVCDLCEGKWAVSGDGMTYTFKIRQNVQFHDGTPLTAADVKATLDKIIFPPEGMPSVRKSWYTQVASVETPEKYTLVVKLKRPLPAIIPALASPFNFVYSKKDLDTHGYAWHKTNINGTGPFKLSKFQAGDFVEGKKNPNYHFKGQPYLDGYRAIVATKLSVRIQAIRGNRAAVDFRGFPPKATQELVKTMGNKIVVQESEWNVLMGAVPNELKKPFDDVRVRQALGYALDRWGGSKYLSQIAIVKTPGGIVFPSHPTAAPKDWLEKNVPGMGANAEANRAKSKALLAEAGLPDLKVTLLNRAVDQPYTAIGTWMVDEWRKAGMKSDQRVVPTGLWYAGLRQSKDFDVSIDFNALTIVNPTIDVSKWTANAGVNYSNQKDTKTDELYFSMLYETDAKKQTEKMRVYEKYVLGERVDWFPTFWWYKITPHRSYMKGWKIAPSHYLNQQLDTVWIDPKLR